MNKFSRNNIVWTTWHRRPVAATGQMAGAKVVSPLALAPMRTNIGTRNNRLILVEAVR